MLSCQVCGGTGGTSVKFLEEQSSFNEIEIPALFSCWDDQVFPTSCEFFSIPLESSEVWWWPSFFCKAYKLQEEHMDLFTVAQVFSKACKVTSKPSKSHSIILYFIWSQTNDQEWSQINAGSRAVCFFNWTLNLRTYLGIKKTRRLENELDLAESVATLNHKIKATVHRVQTFEKLQCLTLQWCGLSTWLIPI